MTYIINHSIFNTYPHIESDRLIFRALTLKDAKDIYLIRSNEKIMTFMDANKHNNILDSELFIQKGLDTYFNKKGLFWAIMDKTSQQLIGDFSFWKIDQKNNRAEIGYSLKSNYLRKGYMTEAIACLVNFGFKDLKLHSFEANINPRNIASRQLLLKIGFKKEAYFKENYYFNGKYLDSEIYSLLESDIIIRTSLTKK